MVKVIFSTESEVIVGHEKSSYQYCCASYLSPKKEDISYLLAEHRKGPFHERKVLEV